MKWLDKLNKLVSENPDARIVHMVAWEDLSSDYQRSSCDDINVELTRYIMWDGEMVDEEEYVLDSIAYNLFSENPECQEWSDENVDIEVQSRYQEYLKSNSWTDAIYINVG